MKCYLFFFLSIFLLCSCRHQAILINQPIIIQPCDTAISFSAAVQPLFVKDCSSAGCHDGNDYPYLGDYLTIHDGIDQIKTAIISKVMPIGDTLSASDENKMLCWIDNGYKNN